MPPDASTAPWLSRPWLDRPWLDRLARLPR